MEELLITEIIKRENQLLVINKYILDQRTYMSKETFWKEINKRQALQQCIRKLKDALNALAIIDAL